MNYWARRLEQEQDKLFNQCLTDAEKRYARAYQQAINDTQRDIKDLYDKLLEETADGKIKPNDLYRYNRYFELQSNLNQRLKELGKKEIKITDEKLL